jgi:hypothetical protein
MRPVVTEVPRPASGITVKTGAVNLKLLVSKFDQSKRGDSDRKITGTCSITWRPKINRH